MHTIGLAVQSLLTCLHPLDGAASCLVRKYHTCSAGVIVLMALRAEEGQCCSDMLFPELVSVQPLAQSGE